MKMGTAFVFQGGCAHLMLIGLEEERYMEICTTIRIAFREFMPRRNERIFMVKDILR